MTDNNQRVNEQSCAHCRGAGYTLPLGVEYTEPCDRCQGTGRAAIEQRASSAPAGWISVDEGLPDMECLAVYVTPNGKQRLIRAKYVRQFGQEASRDEIDQCETEFKEGDEDTLYLKAGWLECIDNWGEYSSCYVVEGVVTHWMPKPPLPGEQAAPEAPAAASVVNSIIDHIAENWPMKKYTLVEIEIRLRALAQQSTKEKPHG